MNQIPVSTVYFKKIKSSVHSSPCGSPKIFNHLHNFWGFKCVRCRQPWVGCSRWSHCLPTTSCQRDCPGFFPCKRPVSTRFTSSMCQLDACLCTLGLHKSNNRRQRVTLGVIPQSKVIR